MTMITPTKKINDFAIFKDYITYIEMNFSKSGNSSKNDKDLQERFRVLRNHNRFLNEEVRKLAKLRETDRNSFYQQEE